MLMSKMMLATKMTASEEDAKTLAMRSRFLMFLPVAQRTYHQQ